MTIQILDEGAGIPSDDLERVFDSFHHVRKRDHGLAGTGLGLSIWKGFVEAMGGTITAGNRTDRSGAVFTHPHAGPDRHARTGRIVMTSLSVKILVVDDEPAIRKLLRVGLTAEGYLIVEATDARTAMEKAEAEQPALILLDLVCPTCRARSSGQMAHELLELPIIILSSRTDEAGFVKALELGADDYVTKPFGIKELAARVRVALRHRLQQQGKRPIFQTGELSVDLVKRIVKLAGKEVKLSPKESDILRVLVQHAGKVITHQHLLSQVWGASADVQYLRIYVRPLRQKIERSPNEPHYITTETGVGYRLREAD